MNSIFEGISKATELIVTLEAELPQIILLSLQVSGTALVIATVLAIPTAGLLGLKRFRGRGACISVLNTFMGLPPVVVGLFVYLLLSRSGPMGFLITSAVILAVSVLAALLWPPTYRSIATILIEEQEVPPDLVRSTITSYAAATHPADQCESHDAREPNADY